MMNFINRKWSVIKTPEKNLKSVVIRKPQERLPDPYAISYDNLKYKFTHNAIEVSVDGTQKGVTVNSGTVIVRQDYGHNAFQSAVTIAQDQAAELLEQRRKEDKE